MAMTRRLRVDLNNQECGAKATELATIVETRAKHKVKLQNDASTGRALQKEYDTKIAELSRDYREQSEERDIECREKPDPKRGVVHIMRLDTDVIVETREMDPSERQATIPGTGGGERPKPTKGGKAN